MRFFGKLFGKVNKIRVQFIDDQNGTTIGIAEMLPEQLPKTFSIGTTINLHGQEWSVEEAVPTDSAEFIKSKQLILKLRKIEFLDTDNILFTTPTISNELPAISNNAKYNDFEIQIREDDWRQKEFLNRLAFPLVEIEIKGIENIIQDFSEDIESTYKAFKKCHVRETIGEPNLDIDFSVLKKILNIDSVGSLKLFGNDGFAADSFSIKTHNITFLGILNQQRVTQLCISDFSNDTIDDILLILKEFDLIFVDWSNCDIISE